VSVLGANSIGINAQTTGDVTITSTGSITSGPDSSHAISALSQSGNVTIVATGDIATADNLAAGIYAQAGQRISLFSGGRIRTRGDDSPAIVAMGYAGVAVANIGNITTTGAASDGIFAVSPAGSVRSSRPATFWRWARTRRRSAPVATPATW
jgi:hypothetical protein